MLPLIEIPSPRQATSTTCQPPPCRCTATLLAAARSGDEQAWAQLVAHYRPMLAGVTRRHGLSVEEAADVAQETWVRLFEQLPALRDPAALPGWLATTARRECIARRRRGWRESPTWDGAWPDFADDGVDPCDRLLDEEQASALHAAVSGLPARERALVEVLLEPDASTYAEVSRRLGMPVGSIGPVRARALRRLRQSLTGDCEPQPLTA